MRKIIVVGSGVIGLSSALLLALEGHKVQVITRNPEEAASWVAGGMLAPFSEGLRGDLFDFSYGSLKEYPEFLRLVKEVSGQSVDFWQEGIYRVVLKGEEGLLELAEGYREAGYGVEFVEPSEASQLSTEVITLINYTEEAWVDAEMLMDALLSAMGRLGVDFVIDEITEVIKEGGEVKRLRGLKSDYTGDFYVFSTGAWTRELFDLPVYPIKGQGMKLKSSGLPKVLYSSISYLIPRKRYLYVGATSEDVGFLGGNTLEGLNRLSEGAVRVAPSLSQAQIMNMHYGYRPATPDEKPIFEAGESYFVATGHHRNGILHAPLTANIVKEYIGGRVLHFTGVFSPNRFS
ncbi:MAG: FAD-dependent oxidoreductase [Aquificaceae bacterium]|uniref:FAD-dependent oxidoreductase n=1 Tax=Hydrogenobacter sp. Uz 6-8 TaxID=3384828 RepID=UPI0030AF8D1A